MGTIDKLNEDEILIAFSDGEYDDYGNSAYFVVPSKQFAKDKLKEYIATKPDYDIYAFLDWFRALPEVTEYLMSDIWMGAYGRWTTEL